jgi:hypothetical protein
MAGQHVVWLVPRKRRLAPDAEKEEKEKITTDDEKLCHYAVSSSLG